MEEKTCNPVLHGATLCNMKTARVMVNLPADVKKRLMQRAKSERRSASNLAVKLIEEGIAQCAHEVAASNELRAFGIDPAMALRDKLAEVQRDQFLSTSTNEPKNQPPAPPVIPESQLCHSPAASWVLAGRATSRPALRVG